ARKGRAATALGTADSGYLTRRLIDVAQDVIILEDDCGTRMGVWLDQPDQGMLESFSERISGRYSAIDLDDTQTGELLVGFNEEIDDAKAARIEQLGMERVYVRSPLTCQAKRGICQYCYGRSPARGALVTMGEAVGIVAAQSIGELAAEPEADGAEPAKKPKSRARRKKAKDEAPEVLEGDVVARIGGRVQIDGRNRISIVYEEKEEREYPVPAAARLRVENGDPVHA